MKSISESTFKKETRYLDEDLINGCFIITEITR